LTTGTAGSTGSTGAAWVDRERRPVAPCFVVSMGFGTARIASFLISSFKSHHARTT